MNPLRRRDSAAGETHNIRGVVVLQADVRKFTFNMFSLKLFALLILSSIYSQKSYVRSPWSNPMAVMFFSSVLDKNDECPQEGPRAAAHAQQRGTGRPQHRWSPADSARRHRGEDQRLVGRHHQVLVCKGESP